MLTAVLLAARSPPSTFIYLLKNPNRIKHHNPYMTLRRKKIYLSIYLYMYIYIYIYLFNLCDFFLGVGVLKQLLVMGSLSLFRSPKLPEPTAKGLGG